jgi:hypothetical protein
MTSTVLNLIGSMLSIWESKERRKYYDEYLELKEEYSKALNGRDNGVMDYLEDRIKSLGEVIALEVKK